jgi:1-acyl-sn-glycerol-3-phosphate acyltransferase
MHRVIMEKKINFYMILRFMAVLIFWTVVFFPALFIPKRFQYKTLWPIFTRLFLFAAKIRTHNCSDISLNKMGNVIFASNQKSFADTFIILDHIRKPFSIVLKEEMNRNFLFKFMAWRMSLITVDREKTMSQVKSIFKIKKLYQKNILF